MMFGTMAAHDKRLAAHDNPGPGRPGQTSARCLVEEIAVFRAKEGSAETSRLSLEVETVLWPTAVKWAGKWYRGIVNAADGFPARWHRVEVENGWLRHANEDAKKNEGEGRGAGGGGTLLPLSSESRK